MSENEEKDLSNAFQEIALSLICIYFDLIW